MAARWDFDPIVACKNPSPGNEQRATTGLAGCRHAGLANYIGIKNPAADALIERIIFAMIAPSHRRHLALDRAVVNHVVPQFTR